MKLQTKSDHAAFTNAGIAVIVALLLGIYCYFIGFSLIIPLLLLFLGLHIFYLKKANIKLFLNLGLLLTLIVFAAYAFTRFTGLNKGYIPVASVAALTILLYNDLQLAFLMAFVSSALTGLVVGFDLSYMLVFFIGSLTGIFTIKNARTRGEMIKSGFLIGIIQAICVILISPSLMALWHADFARYTLYPFAINGIISIGVVMITLKVFEWLFGVVTNFSLLELSDFDQPLLKSMVLECPGTYHHSLIVSNISEAAADAIGANSLLTRVGAYYHDVGKLIKPEYFTENQAIGSSKHDKLEPSMSRLVILNHVKEGLELAKKNKLSEQIMDFIPQHHGTSLIYYFYQRALEDAEKDEKVDEANFRYPGPKPQIRETAIVMLADSVEGAVRALQEPTLSRIEEVVRKIINNKFIDGQLDECNLTLKEIDRIGAVFTRTLGAMYHSRIQYPDKKNGSPTSNRKLSEKNSPKAQPNQEDRKKNP